MAGTRPPRIATRPAFLLRKPAKALLTLLGLGLLVGMIMWAGPHALWAHLHNMDAATVFAVVLIIAAGTLLSAVNSFVICGASQVIRFAAFVRVYWVAWAIGLIVPGQVGDVFTLGYALRRRGMPLTQIAARTTMDKILSLLCSLMVATQLFRLDDDRTMRYLSLSASALVFGFVVATAISILAVLCVRNLNPGNRWLRGALSMAMEMGLIVLKRPHVVAFNLVLSLLKIAMTGASYWLVARALVHHSLSFPNVTIAAISGGLVAYLPLSANGIGTVEVAGASLFGTIGMELAAVLSMYIVLRVTNMVLAWLPAAFLLPEFMHRDRT